jgi:hypothetical protein
MRVGTLRSGLRCSGPRLSQGNKESDSGFADIMRALCCAPCSLGPDVVVLSSGARTVLVNVRGLGWRVKFWSHSPSCPSVTGQQALPPPTGAGMNAEAFRRNELFENERDAKVETLGRVWSVRLWPTLFLANFQPTGLTTAALPSVPLSSRSWAFSKQTGGRIDHVL